MEALLRDLKEYGLKELQFMIVNSKERLSIAMIEELRSRVSFPVYQETEEEPVWSVLGGAKDDMYVYDRCGRLTYYIPFPLSIIHEKQPIVKAAIFSTYFQNPCGLTCTQNTTFSIDLVEEQKTGVQSNDVVPDEEQVEVDQFNVSSTLSTPQDDSQTDTLVEAYIPDYYYADGNLSSADNHSISKNNTTRSIQGWNKTNQNTSNSYHDKYHNDSLIRTLLKLFWLHSDTKPTPAMNNSLEAIMEESNDTVIKYDEIHHHTQENHTINPTTENSNQENYIMNPTTENTDQEKLNDIAVRCQGAEENVCKSWSKKRLMEAQECCGMHAGPTNIAKSDELSCKKYGKKHCKKIKIVLKCCLKTGLISQKGSEEVEANVENKEIK